MIYLIGSLRNPEVPNIAKQLRLEGFEVFDDWYAAGERADDSWKDYEQARGRSFSEGLRGAAAQNVYAFDKRNLDKATETILILPAGKSGHLELGYSIGSGKRGYILVNDPDRWDVMYQFATLVTTDLSEIINDIKQVGQTIPGTGETGRIMEQRSLNSVRSSNNLPPLYYLDGV